ncbi:hypothetical protein FACS1894151_09760 [Spirochaetia bacterium]|nr:hypothetical protein FACS1894151_09760 [Spirochaetia bacterium]
MEKTTLGRTNLNVTVAGLGCGGHSQLGIKKYGLDHAADIVRAAYDGGVNFFDTAVVYGTQGAVGKGLAGIPRTSYVLSTKFPYQNRTASELEASLEESLKELNTDYIDIYHLHGVAPEDYTAVKNNLVPAMLKAQQAGKIRFLGITEVFGRDMAHAMFGAALADGIFDVIMTGYNILNPSAAKVVLPAAIEKNIGVLCMFAVRSALSNPAQLEIDINRIVAAGQAGPALKEALAVLESAHKSKREILDFLVHSGVGASIMEASYRFCRHTKGIHVTLTGTGSEAHLKDNLASIQGERLSDEILAKLEALFGNVNCISGQ